jgi:hypothetical protein
MTKENFLRIIAIVSTAIISIQMIVLLVQMISHLIK